MFLETRKDVGQKQKAKKKKSDKVSMTERKDTEDFIKTTF